MIKKTITFEDFDGNTLTEDFYFNLSKAEALELQFTDGGTLEENLTTLTSSSDREAMRAFKDLIRGAVGRRSDDGRRFIKSKEIADDFMESNAWSEFIVELMKDPETVISFIEGCLPNDLVSQAQQNPQYQAQVSDLRQKIGAPVRPQTRDHMQKQQPSVPQLPTAPPVLYPTPQSAPTVAPAQPAPGYVTPPPHESGPGYQLEPQEPTFSSGEVPPQVQNVFQQNQQPQPDASGVISGDQAHQPTPQHEVPPTPRPDGWN